MHPAHRLQSPRAQRSAQERVRGQAQGNVLFIILIAIALFGALSFTVTQTGDGGTQNAITKEQAKVYATDIIQYAKEVENAVQRVLNRAASEQDVCLDFDAYPGGDATYEHSGCASDRNKVFEISGGGAAYRTARPEWLDNSMSAVNHYGNFFYTTTCLLGMGSDPDGDTCNNPAFTVRHGELMMFLPALRAELCQAINQRLHGDIAIGDDPSPYFHNIPFIGRYNENTAHTNGTNITGRRSGCLRNTTSGENYIFFHALHIR